MAVLRSAAAAFDVPGLVTASKLVCEPGWEDFVPHVISGLAWKLLGFCTSQLPGGHVSQLATQQAYYFADLIADCPRAILVGVLGAVAGDARFRDNAPFMSPGFLRPWLGAEQVCDQLAVVDVRRREPYRNAPFSVDLGCAAAGRFGHSDGAIAFLALDDTGMSHGAVSIPHSTGDWALSVDASSTDDVAVLSLKAPAGVGPDLAVKAVLGSVLPDRHDLCVRAPVSGRVRRGEHIVPIQRRQPPSTCLGFLPDFQTYGRWRRRWLEVYPLPYNYITHNCITHYHVIIIIILWLVLLVQPVPNSGSRLVYILQPAPHGRRGRTTPTTCSRASRRCGRSR